MELSKQYIMLDTEKYSDYDLYKILNNLSGIFYSIYHMKKNNIFYYHEPDNVILSIKSLKENFTNLQNVLDFVSNNKIKKDTTKKINISKKNIYNLGRKKINVKFILDKKKLELYYSTLKKSDISEDIPKELLSSPVQIFQMIYYELDKINKNHTYPHYYKPIDESIYNLEMNIFNSKIGNFKFEVSLDPFAFPVLPPKIKIIEPCLERNVMLQINNLNDLTIDKWNPIVSLEYLLNKFAEKVVNLKDHINIDSNTNIIFEKLNSMLATISGIALPKIVDFNLEFHKMSLKNKTASKYWDAGTGYGHDGTTKWDIKSFYKNKLNREKEKLNIVNELLEFIEEKQEIFINNFKNSIIERFITDFIKSINILEYSKKTELYEANFKMIKKLTDMNIISITSKTKKGLVNFYDNIKSLWNQEDYTNENMGNIVTLIDSIQTNIDVIETFIEINTNKKVVYEEMVRKYQFEEGTIPNNYKYSKKNKSLNKKAMIRIMSENQSLRDSLPVNWDTSILMRINKDCMNYSSFIIVGPEDTPYHNGLFEFHMYYPAEYPNENPLVNLMTTGDGTVRFNPNLYNCGKVCLSLLGTWRGEEGESWNPKMSTVLQLLISIQSLIFIKEPYFNEPGWERDRGTKKGDTKSKQYNELRELETIRWAINDKIKNPLKGFEEFTKQHFIMKTEELLEITLKWCENCTQLTYKQQITEERETMIKLLYNLKDTNVINSNNIKKKLYETCISDSSEDEIFSESESNPTKKIKKKLYEMICSDSDDDETLSDSDDDEILSDSDVETVD